MILKIKDKDTNSDYLFLILFKRINYPNYKYFDFILYSAVLN